MANRSNCATCEHKDYPDGGHCYMFRTEPEFNCQQHKLRSDVQGQSIPVAAVTKAKTSDSM